MFYAIIVFILVILFLAGTNRGNLSSLHMIAVLVCYMMALIFLALYLSKDTYYYNTANHYFALPKSIWKVLLLLSVNKSTIIRLCNLTVLGVIFLGVLFSLSFMHPSLSAIAPKMKWSTSAILLTELLIYDPAFIRRIYYILYPRFLDVSGFTAFQSVLHGFTMILNLSLILISLFLLVLTIKKTPGLRLLRMNIFSITVSYLFIMLTFVYIFFRYPCVMVKFSKFSGTVTYLPAPLQSNSILYQIFPYFLIFTLLLATVSIYTSNDITLRLRREDFSISKQIAASDITSRTFCHYMKNELLAIQAELDNLELNDESAAAVQNVVNRCDHLYKRLDTIHRNTHSAVLIMQKEDLGSVMANLVEEHLKPYSDIHVVCHFDKDCPPALIDRNYFEQAILNILSNAVEAVEKNPPGRRRIDLSLGSLDNWIVLTIHDTGVGIPKENLHHIFMPFYTSEPIARHWGIGLSLTHKIITAHEGHIEVDSSVNVGTTFQIMLPIVQSNV